MIRHVLADGKEVESIEGMVVPAKGAAASAYQIVAEFARNRMKAMATKEMLQTSVQKGGDNAGMACQKKKVHIGF